MTIKFEPRHSPEGGWVGCMVIVIVFLTLAVIIKFLWNALWG